MEFKRYIFSQNDNQLFDSQGNRLIACMYCGKIDKTKEFVSYGGKDTMNWGECNECYNNRRKEDGIQKSL